MKRLFSIGLLVLLGTLAPTWADGLIIVHEPIPWLPPGPPSHRLPPPLPRPYPFAPLEVRFHQVEVRIKDQVAVTRVDQEFYNPNDRQLEGTYLFPIPTGAQIDKFSMDIGGQQVEAELLSADKARQIYEDIVRKMKDPALLEYAGRDVFKVRVYPIEPHGAKRIKLAYTQVLKADAGLVGYLYPLNTEKFSAKPIKTVSVKIQVETRQPLKTIYSPSHTVEIRRGGAHQATIGFEAADARPDTDFQLYFAQEAKDLGLNLMTHRTDTEDGYFLLLAAPGLETKRNQVQLKDVVFVLDTSGSMAGKKLAQAKKALQFCVENLNDGDRFEILRFSTDVEPLFTRLTAAGQESRARAVEFVEKLKPTGGTALDEALRQALALRPEKGGRPYAVVFLTDGRPTVGNTDENQILTGVKKAAGGRTRVFCFGIGSDVNTHLLDKVTEDTRAFSQYVLPEEDIEVKVSNFFTKIKEPVLTNPTLTFPEPVRATRLYPSPLPDLFRGDQLILVGRYAGAGNGPIGIEGQVSGQTCAFAYEGQFPARNADNDFIPRLWATRRVGYLLDEIRLHGENSELRDEVTELARKYGIVTPYTAYLILEDETRRNVPLAQQSLPLMNTDHRARQLLNDTWNDYRQQKSGDAAVAGARYGMALRHTENSAAAVDLGNAAVFRGVPALSAPNALGGGGFTAPGTAPAAPARQLAQQARFVNGRNFFQNGNQWVDTRTQQLNNAKPVRIQFNSSEYFALLKKQPESAPWLALGQNVQFVLKDTWYEVYE